MRTPLEQAVREWAERRRFMQMRDYRRLLGSRSTSRSPDTNSVVTPFQIHIPSHGPNAPGPYSGSNYPRIGARS